MLQKLVKRMKGEGGFTLIELLVVIIIIAILAAIAIPTFLGQRQKAQDAAAKSLVRNAMTVMESDYVDTRDFTKSTADSLKAIEPSLVFTKAGSEGAAATTPTATTALSDVNFFSANIATYAVGTLASSGNTWGVRVNKSALDVDGVNPGVTYYKNTAITPW